MTVRKDFMLCHTGHGLAATRRPFGDAHLPVGHSTRTRISSHYQTTQHKNKVSTLSGDLTEDKTLNPKLPTPNSKLQTLNSKPPKPSKPTFKHSNIQTEGPFFTLVLQFM